MASDTLLIHEIYSSIQGESSFAGRRCAFIRLSACNLRCKWCDTPQAFTGGTRLPRAEVGDLVAVFCAGAYGASASPADFLGHGAARQMLV